MGSSFNLGTSSIRVPALISALFSEALILRLSKSMRILWVNGIHLTHASLKNKPFL